MSDGLEPTKAPVAVGLLDERLEIETPERVNIVYELAGIGSRFAAGVIDVAILVFVFLALSFIVLLAASVSMPETEEQWAAFGFAAGGAFTAALSLYYVGFEWAWAGQTPGKRALDLRVLSDEGGPASVGAVFVRNILRVVDVMPVVACYGVGGAVMFVNRRAKRIGDYAAGTIVVRERPEPLAPAPRGSVAAPTDDALDAALLARVRSFVARAPQMIAGSRAALARRIADDVAKRHDLAFDDPERFLRLVAAGRSPRELRESQGPRP